MTPAAADRSIGRPRHAERFDACIQQHAHLYFTLCLQSSTGSALAFTISNAAVAQQSLASGAADATTTTGQAAALGASQAVGGVHAGSSGASTATTLEGNALSVGSSIASRGLAAAAAVAACW